MNAPAALLLDATPHRKAIPPSWYERIDVALGIVPRSGGAVELTTGIGDGARGLAARGAAVTAVEADAALLAQARQMTAPGAGPGSIRWVHAAPEATGLPDASADLVAIVQAMHRLDAARAMAEAMRLLRPRGRIIAVQYDWQPLPRNVVEATEKLVAEALPDLRKGGTNGLYGEWIGPVRAAGFVEHQAFLHDVDAVFSRDEWRRYVGRTFAGRLAPAALADLDARLADTLARSFGPDLIAPHRCFALVAQKP